MTYTINSEAQIKKSEEPTKNISACLDNGKPTNKYNLIKLRLAPLLTGFIGLNYENKINRKFSVEAGLYTRILSLNIIEPSRWDEGRNINYDVYETDKFKSGFGVMIYPKSHFARPSINKTSYIGVRAAFYASQLERNVYNGISTITEKVSLQHSNYTVGYGMHTNIFSNITLGSDVLMGVFFDKYKNATGNNIVSYKKGDYKVSGLAFIFDLHIGFIF